MAKFSTKKIATYRRKDGTKVGSHTRKVKQRSYQSRAKGNVAKLRGQLSKAIRGNVNADKKNIKKLKGLIKRAVKSINSVRLGKRKFKQGTKYQKRRRGAAK